MQSLDDEEPGGRGSGSTGDIWATAAQGRYGFNSLARYEGLAPAMLDLQSWRIDAYLDIPSLLYYAKDKPFLPLSALRPVSATPSCWRRAVPCSSPKPRRW